LLTPLFLLLLAIQPLSNILDALFVLITLLLSLFPELS
jgi:hypothetical protein